MSGLHAPCKSVQDRLQTFSLPVMHCVDYAGGIWTFNPGCIKHQHQTITHSAISKDHVLQALSCLPRGILFSARIIAGFIFPTGLMGPIVIISRLHLHYHKHLMNSCGSLLSI